LAPGPPSDPANWDAFGLYLGPTDYQPDYHGGTISTEYYPEPTIFQPGSVYTQSGREHVAPAPQSSPPATAPPSSASTVEPGMYEAPYQGPGQYADQAPATAPPAQAPVTAPPVTDAWGGQPASAQASAASGPVADPEELIPAHSRKAMPRKPAPPATAPRGTVNR
jgi:hypothetical protein